MGAYLEQLFLIWTLPLFAVIVILDIVLSAWHHRGTYTVKDTLTNIYMAILDGTLDAVMRYGFVMAYLTWVYEHRVVNMQLSGFTYWFLLFLAEDFSYYVMHYVDHKCRFFWAVHVTHHSSLYFNLTTGFRSPVLQPLYRGFYYVPLAWLGFPPADIMVMYAATQVYGSLVHTERVKSLGFLEWFMVTPSHHRVHHSSNPKYLDKNMGMALIIWDRLFGTFAKEDPAEPCRYGLTKPIEDRGPVNIVFHEWRDMAHDLKTKARTFKDKLGFIFGPPGWQPKSDKSA